MLCRGGRGWRSIYNSRAIWLVIFALIETVVDDHRLCGVWMPFLVAVTLNRFEVRLQIGVGDNVHLIGRLNHFPRHSQWVVHFDRQRQFCATQ